MKLRVLALLMGLALAGCASDSDVPNGVDLKQAARINTQLGADYMRHDQMDLASAKLKRAIDQDPDYAIAHSTLAFYYSRVGDNQTAESEYRKALSLEPNNGQIRNNYGVFLCGQGKVAEARRMLLDAVRDRDYGTPAAAWTNAGVCSRQNKDDETAQEDFRKALQINPNFGDALAQMADLSYRSGDYLRARAFVERYMSSATQPTPSVLWTGLMTERKLGAIDAARKYEKRLKRDYPDSQEAITLKTYKR